MSDLRQRIDAFVKLGEFFRSYCEYVKNDVQITENQKSWFFKFDEAIAIAKHKNGWFTRENILFAIQQWGKLLVREKLENWILRYDPTSSTPKTVALIMAGNIPLVGFHDFLSVLMTGNTAMIKLSSNDRVLLPLVSEYLIEILPLLSTRIIFKEDRFENYDAVIATGSNNTARYFEYYFGKVPHIIRKNRNSVAVLTGNETPAQLNALGEDIFRYFGLGCRNVSKLFVPKGYVFDTFLSAIDSYKALMDQVKYANNYDYNKAVYLMSEFEFIDNGFLILKRDIGFASPIATLSYEEYDSLNALKNLLVQELDKIQCIVGNGILLEEVDFGETQKPDLATYADHIDTVEFLLKTS
ncbi:MAG: acyl-CoA reductase [Maribacter sp.]|nr:acyl-CoA reductase [Maribacter sp.]